MASPMRPYISVDKLFQDDVRFIYNSLGRNVSDTAWVLKKSRQTIYNVLKWHANDLTRPPKIGRPIKFTDEMKLFIVLHTIAQPTVSGEEMSRMINQQFGTTVSRTLVNNFRNSRAFKYRNRIKVLPFTPVHLANRINFATEFLQSGIPHRNLLFSDEKWFFRENVNGKVWKLKGMVYDGVTAIAQQYPMKVLIWGCIGYNFKSNLIFTDKSITTEVYFDDIIFGSDLLITADSAFGGRNWIFMQDNAPAHVSNDALCTFDHLEVKLLEGWPARSPDLNPIEILWAIMANEVYKHPPETKEELKIMVASIWNNVPLSTINALIDGFPLRLQDVIGLNGQQVHY
jgi:hypothetical protein